MQQHPAKRVALLVSKFDHCLLDILHRSRIGEVHIEITSVISNHPDCAELSAMHGLDYHHVPIRRENKAEGFAQLGEPLEKRAPEVIVLARFMQIMPPDLWAKYTHKIIRV